MQFPSFVHNFRAEICFSKWPNLSLQFLNSEEEGNELNSQPLEVVGPEEQSIEQSQGLGES